ncbi:protein NO VEIN domain-containing protein [Methylobacterium sp. 22177]|uniref:protein NO VEIN domain-containing protein n=1 Tax=Methylobacterium sp. 22177 TaxID=3453885 RepID=UPI003F8580F5
MKYAVKKLTMSDLTYFEQQFRRYQTAARAVGEQGSKQKAINLNADVLVDDLFPLTRGTGNKQRFNMPLSIYGPGLRLLPHALNGKIISPGGGGKNWRLNGQLVANPDFDPTRYDGLAPGDLAVFGFEGDVAPTEVLLVLVSQNDPDDASINAALSAYLGNRKMAAMDAAILAPIVALSADQHPIRELLDPEADVALEDAALGSSEGVRRLRRRGASRRMSAEALQQARARAEAVGRSGEVLIDDWLQQEVAASRLRTATWIADVNAVSSWDFEVEGTDGTKQRIEVKATSGDFSRHIHISQAEIESAAERGARTDLYRLYGLTNDTATLRICKDIGGFAAEILAAVAGLGEGIVPDGYTVRPERVGTWDPPIQIRLSDDED